ncbi:hypothetical protein F5Y15DRAFT_417666 [Xylariaceae sp. FL0016]|nr:hypothetical protein F5Y15DRAFT_417666 [Xylariaceae sp. FL0016]
MANTTNQSLKALLCEDRWALDSARRSHIAFKEDGTGQIVLRRDAPIFICAEIEWRPMTPASFDEPISADDDDDAQRELRFEIEIKMTQRRPSSFPRVESLKINEHVLTDDAFAAKTYAVTLENKGEFRSLEDLAMAEMSVYAEKFGRRLTFDASPYPPRSEWKKPEGMADANKPWEWKRFCSQRLPRDAAAS